MIAVLVSLVLSASTPNFAQSVADAARQERERRKEQARHATHVYTNEDLSKSRILIPEDEARVMARKNEPGSTETAASAEAATVAPAAPVPAAPSAIAEGKELAARSAFPAKTEVTMDVVPPANGTTAAPTVIGRQPQKYVSAPAVAEKSRANQIVILPASVQGSANVTLPATISKPLAKKTAGRLQPEAPVAGITLPATAMPFSTSMAYGPANVAPLASTSPSGVSELKRHTNFEVSAPTVTPRGVSAPAKLFLTEHSIVRPSDPVKEATAPGCAGPCNSTTVAASPVEVVTRTEVRSVVANSERNPAGDVMKPSQSRAIAGTTETVKVEPGDSLWKLAERYFGNGRRWKQLAALNPQLADPSLIRAGQWIRVAAERKQTGKQVVIQPGDTLWRVAKAELGSPLAFNCIAQANPQLRSVDVVRAGETLVVPATCDDVDKTQN